MRHLEYLERNHLISVPSLPNFDNLGNALRMVSLPHDALEFMWYSAAKARPNKSGTTTHEPLRGKCDQNWKGR